MAAAAPTGISDPEKARPLSHTLVGVPKRDPTRVNGVSVCSAVTGKQRHSRRRIFKIPAAAIQKSRVPRSPSTQLLCHYLFTAPHSREIKQVIQKMFNVPHEYSLVHRQGPSRPVRHCAMLYCS